jgi:hypothetical protein
VVDDEGKVIKNNENDFENPAKQNKRPKERKLKETTENKRGLNVIAFKIQVLCFCNGQKILFTNFYLSYQKILKICTYELSFQ